MAVGYKDFMDYASEAIKSPGCEFSRRNSISRSYYSVYHAALAYADTVSLPPVSAFSGPTHRKLSEFYEGNLNADRALRLMLRRLGYQLKQMHVRRCDADYQLEETITLESAQDHLMRCQKSLEEFESLLAGVAA